jgi:uncharacterized protein (TIGR03382 family)
MRAASQGAAAPRTPSSGVWRVLAGGGVVVLGCFVTVAAATRVIYHAEGYAPGDADCDDCGITLVLDNLGWLAAAVGGYLVLLMLLASWLLRRRRFSAGEGDPLPLSVQATDS